MLRDRRFVRPRRIAALASVLATACVLSGCSLVGSLSDANLPVRDDDGRIIEGNEATDAFSLRVGDCLNDALTDQVLSTVPTVPCDEPHDSEIYASLILGDTSYPGLDAVREEADAACLSDFEAFVGIDYLDSRLDFSYIFPTESSWSDGDREILCVIYDPSGEQLTGSLEGVRE